MRGVRKTEFSTCVYIYISLQLRTQCKLILRKLCFVELHIWCALWLRNFVWFFGFEETKLLILILLHCSKKKKVCYLIYVLTIYFLMCHFYYCDAMTMRLANFYIFIKKKKLIFTFFKSIMKSTCRVQHVEMHFIFTIN